jgi:hypothetical protein
LILTQKLSVAAEFFPFDASAGAERNDPVGPALAIALVRRGRQKATTGGRVSP